MTSGDIKICAISRNISLAFVDDGNELSASHIVSILQEFFFVCLNNGAFCHRECWGSVSRQRHHPAFGAEFVNVMKIDDLVAISPLKTKRRMMS